MATFATTGTPHAGQEKTAKDAALETGAGLIQNFTPVKQICAHLNAFHAYADAPTSRAGVETNHYCAHLPSGVRQCVLYDGTGPDARLIGVEYMIPPAKYAALPAAERALWHSHVFEVKSGMLVMPGPAGIAGGAWERAETEEMREVVTLYGKVYHLWQVDRGDELPLGEPKLMTSFTEEGQLDAELWKKRDEKFGVETERKKDARKEIEEPEIHPDADQAWQTTGKGKWQTTGK